MSAGTHVREIVGGIQQSNSIASESAERTETFLHEQTAMLHETVSTFDAINNGVTDLVQILESIKEKVDNMQDGKAIISQSIGTINTLSDQISDSVKNVAQMVTEKTAEIEMIKISAAVNSEARRKSRGKNRAEPGFSVFPFSSGFPGIASALSRDTIFSKKIRIHG